MNGYALSFYDEELNLFGYPQKYKDIELHPIKIKDVKIQKIFYKLFTQPKHIYRDYDILKMSYLKFMIIFLREEKDVYGKEVQKELARFFLYITHQETSVLWDDDLNFSIKIGNSVFTENDFDNIREILLEQNGTSIEYINEFDPTLEKNLAFINRDYRDLTFDDQVALFSAMLHRTIPEVGDSTIYQMIVELDKLVTLKNYGIYAIQPTKDSDIQHFIYHTSKKGRYDSLLIDKSKFMKDSGFEDNPMII